MGSIGIAVLAAGKGTRLKIETPKALCPALGRGLVDYVVDAIEVFSKANHKKSAITVVVGHKREQVQAHLEDRFPGRCHFAWQKEQKGTADALRSYFSECPDNWNHEWTFVACADTPLLTPEVFQRLWQTVQASPKTKACAATFQTPLPQGYGRILRGSVGFSIVEEKDATDEQRLVNEVNSGFYLVKTEFLKERLSQIGNKNKSGEFYLTDLFTASDEAQAVLFEDASVFLGVNTLEQLEEITQVLKRRKLRALMSAGVTIMDTHTTWADWNVEVEAETVLYPGVQLFGSTRLGRGVRVESGAVIKDSVVEASAEILAYSHLEKSRVAAGAHVGPFARLRPEADIGSGAKVGNFVEIKKSRLAQGAKVSHLSYVGDAEIGENSNIGCGFITCNYDGVNKHRTIIGKNTFVGSDVQAVAPVSIGDDAFVAAGSTVTKNVPSGGFAIARSSQTTKEGMAHRFLRPKGKS